MRNLDGNVENAVMNGEHLFLIEAGIRVVLAVQVK